MSSVPSDCPAREQKGIVQSKKRPSRHIFKTCSKFVCMSSPEFWATILAGIQKDREKWRLCRARVHPRDRPQSIAGSHEMPWPRKLRLATLLLVPEQKHAFLFAF